MTPVQPERGAGRAARARGHLLDVHLLLRRLFFYVDALARAGRLTEAELTFQKMFTYANHLGLYSEEIVDTIPALRPTTVGYPAIDAAYW